MSFNISQCVGLHGDAPSTSGHCLDVRRVLAARPVHRAKGSVLVSARDRRAMAFAGMAPCELSRPPIGPCTILCSSLGKERKKLAKVLKSHRKVLEKRLSALHRADIDVPVLSELLSELRVLTSRLESQRSAGLHLHSLMNNSDSSSDSDDDECHTQSAASLYTSRAGSLQPTLPTTVTPSAPDVTVHYSASSAPPSDTILVSTLSGQIEVPVSPPQEGWTWDEEEFRAAKFEGAGGRIMVCTGGKCQRKGATEVLRAVSALSEHNANIEVLPCKCVGKCSAGAALRVRPLGQPCATYTEVRPAELREVFQKHFAVESQLQQQATGASEALVSDSSVVSTTNIPHVTCCAGCMEV